MLSSAWNASLIVTILEWIMQNGRQSFDAQEYFSEWRKTEEMKKRLTALAMVLVLLMSGCQNTTESLTGETVPITEIAEEKNQEASAMGRYVESVTDLSDMVMVPQTIRRLSDGTIVILDSCALKVVSHDNGETWEQEPVIGLNEDFEQENYIMDMNISPDGTIVIAYSPSVEEDVESDFDAHYMLISLDGTQCAFTMELAADELYVRRFFFDEAGVLYATVLGGNSIYEINIQDGSSRRFLSLENCPRILQFQGNTMIITTEEGILFYDRNQQQYLADTVVNDFVKEQYGILEDYGNYFAQYLFTDQEGAVYIGGSKGLHRHIIGGTTVEQVIDGKLSSFSDPSHGIEGIIALDSQEFMALFSDAKVVKFTYDPDVPTVPNEKLTVYSLQSNETIQQAISMYQVSHPERYIEYEIGRGEDNSITREDALKKLNTQLMSGEGPDILVLNDMPVDSYMEKGILLDISDTIQEIEGAEGLFTNLIEPFYEGNALYMVPCEIQLPVVSGQKEKVTQMSDLTATATVIEQIQRENPEREILSVYSEKGIMKLFSMVSAPAWKQEDGTLDTAAIQEFLTQTKRIYDAQMKNASADKIEWYVNLNDMRFPASFGMTYEDSDWILYINALNYIAGELKLNWGTVKYPYDYAEVASIAKAAGFEDTVLLPAKGQCSDVYIPKTLVGINASSAYTDASRQFLEAILGSEIQTMLHNGFPVNRTAYEAVFTPNPDYVDENNLYGSIVMSNEDGLTVDMNVYWPDDAQIQTITEWMTSARVPYLYDNVLEEAVYDAGADYFQGMLSLEETIEEIEEKVAIYAAE